MANSVNVVTVNTEKNNTDATLNISPRDADSSTADDHDVALQAGRNTRITVTVTAEDRRTRQTYTIMVYRDRSTRSTDATLSALSLDGVSLSPRFSSGTIAYDARVRYDVKTVTVAATNADVGAFVPDVDAEDEDPDNVSSVDSATDRVVTLAGVGYDTDITVTVTPEAGAGIDNVNIKIYTITVYRESGPVLSDDATLAADPPGLSLADDTTPVLFGTTDSEVEFAPGTTEYKATVENEVESVTVAATPNDSPGATVEIMPADQDTSEEAIGHQVYLTPGTNTVITATVTAENGSKNTYTVTVYHKRATASTDATLSALSLAGVSLSPRFSSGTIAYDARVRYDVKTVTVAATAADIGATVPDVDAEDEDPDNVSIVDSATDRVVTLAGVGYDTDITVTVMPEAGAGIDNANIKIYTITVYRESGPVLDDDATLAVDPPGLSLTSVPTLTPEYAADTTEYTASVPNNVGFVTVTATPADDPGAMVDIMPADQNSLTEDHQVYLAAGANTVITVTVTAENGSTNTYTVTVYRKRATASTDATLSALSLAGVNLSPDFDSETTAYDARVRYDVGEVTIEATTADIGAVAPVTVDGDTTPGDSVEGNVVTLGAQGMNTVITVTVTPESDQADDEDNKIYKITVYRENIVLSDMATLVTPADVDPGLLGTGVTPTPAFAPDTNEYTARATPTTEFAFVDAKPADDPGAMVDIMPADRDSLTEGHQIYLTPGANTAITITVTAEDGSTNTYTFMVYRERTTASTDANLSALSLSGAVLSPVFDPERYDYTATAAYNTDITTVTATANDIGIISTMIVPVDSDLVTAGHQLPLSDRGATNISITVKPESGANIPDDDKKYTITVYRDTEASSDATLQSLTLSGITLSPAFDPATTAYTAEAEDIEMTTVEAMATHPGATVEGAGMRTLTAGENVISVTVTAEDETTEETYTVTVTVLGEDTLLERYDIDGNGLDKSEVLNAIDDFLFNDTLTKEQVLHIINLYLFG